MAPGTGDPLGIELGRMAVERGWISTDQLTSFHQLQAQLGGRHHLGALLVARGALTEQQLHDLLSQQQASPSRPSTTSPRVPERPTAPAPAAPPRRTAAGEPRMYVAPSVDDLDFESERPPAAGAPPRSSYRATADLLRPVEESYRGLRSDARDRGAAAEPAGSKIVRLLELAERERASDVHLHASAPPALRIEGQLRTVASFRLDAREQERLILELLGDEERKHFLEENDLDLSIETPTGLRCRVNVYRTQFGVDATFRLVRRLPPTLAELGLPETVARFTEAHQGLVLVTGPAGSGKSTTLAALVDLINADRAEHILSLEDPIEILHPEKRALVNQRQVGRDTKSFARALRGALREDPDVIVIGELRDRETISLAVTAAETGHLVLGSMHTSSAARTVARILDAFPPSQQSQVRAMVSESLKGIVSQRLVTGVDGKRVAAAEVLVVTPAVSNLIRDGKLYQIRSMMQTGRQLGMRTLDDALKELVAAGRITSEEARRHLENHGAMNADTPEPSAHTPPVHAAPHAGPTPPQPSERKSAPGGFASFLRRPKG